VKSAKKAVFSSDALEFVSNMHELDQCLYRWGVATQCDDEGVYGSSYVAWINFYRKAQEQDIFETCSEPDFEVVKIQVGAQSCSGAVGQNVNSAWQTTLVTKCKAQTESAESECSPTCIEALKSKAFQAMEGQDEVECLQALVQGDVKAATIGMSQDTVDFIARNTDAMALCAASSGTRIPGLVAGKCTSKGMAEDCAGNGVCEEESSDGVDTEFVCVCNEGFAGKYCQKTAEKSEVFTKYEEACPETCPDGGTPQGGGDVVICEPVDFAGEEVKIPLCECAAGFFGESCEKSADNVRKENEAQLQKKVIADKLEEIKQDKLTACQDSARPFQCPKTDADSGGTGKCVTKPLDCYVVDNDGDVDGDGAAGFAQIMAQQARIESERDQCGKLFSGEETGEEETGEEDRIAVCADLLAPLRACQDARCPDGSCAASISECKTSLEDFTNTVCADVAKPVLCADSITCKESEQECARVVAYDGCAPGKVSCPARPSVCVEDLASCQQETGCASGLMFCGFKRIKGTAVIDEETARPVPICKVECTAEIVQDPAPTEINFDLVTEDVPLKISSADSNTNSRPAMMMVTHASTAITSTLNSSSPAAPTISISSLPSSYKQNGPFSQQLSTLLSTIISIEPSSSVDVAPGKLEFCFAINDEFGNDSEDQCQSVTDNAAVVYATDTSIDAESKYYAGCSMRFDPTDGCFCCTFATHFSVYTVSDVAAADSSQDQLLINAQAVSSSADVDRGTNAASEIEIDNQNADGDLGANPNTADSGGGVGVGGIIGGVVATLCLIGAIAAVAVHKKRKQRLRAQSAGGSVFEIAERGTENPITTANADLVRGSVNPNWAHARPGEVKSALHLAHGAESSRALDLAHGAESRLGFHNKGRTFNDDGDEPAQTTSGFNLDAVEDNAIETNLQNGPTAVARTGASGFDLEKVEAHASHMTLHKQRSTEEV